MARSPARLVAHTVMVAFLMTTRALRLYPCDSTGYHDVVESTSATFHCDVYSGPVEWWYTPPNSQAVRQSTCDATQCTRPVLSAFTATVISAGNSSFTTTLTTKDVRTAGGEYKCQDQGCRVHIIVPAVVTKPTSTITRTDQGYSSRCNSNVTQVYSSRGQYSCVWQMGSETRSVTPNLQPSPSDTNNTSDRTGSCDVTLPVPSNNTTYTCTVTVKPGNTQSSSDNIQITRPPPPQLLCSSAPVSENSNFRCTCRTENIGQPGGRLRWYTGTATEVVSGAYDVSNVTMTWLVTRSDDLRKFWCVNNWAVNISSVEEIIVTVVYGPDSVAIEGNTTFYTDANASSSLNLTCQPSGAGPSSALTYTWNIACADSNQKHCSFKPRPPSPGNSGDVNRTITCTVTNTKNNNQRQHGSVTLNLKYPPSSPPQISGYVNNIILYQGDNLTLTCSVTGGDPAVTSVTLTCPDKHDNSPSQGQSSSLMITSLSDDDNNLRCICSGQWVRPSYYTATDSRTLRVYYPPSTPVIHRTDGSSFPFMEKDNVTLTCNVTNPGYPEAKLSWSDSSVTSHRLQLNSVGKRDNLRNITCRATNAFTQHKGRELLDIFTLHVYYGPYVSLTSLEGNDCPMTSTPPVCVVTEGQRVHVQAEADSNPAHRPYAWKAPPGSDLDLGTGVDLDISSINKTHSGVYQVIVETEKPDANDDRLPLTTTHNLTVLVTYPSSSVTLVNVSSNNRTVNENDTVIFDCQSRGRPTPELQLNMSDRALQRAEGGKLSLSEVTTRLSHTLTAQCNNTGLYTCSAHNGLGDTQRDTAQLYVNCKPRSHSASSTKPREVNYVDKPVFVEFQLVAFPVPDNNSFTFRVNDSDTNIPDNIKLNVTCSTTYTDYDVNCSVLISDVTSKEAEGLYSLRAANAFGQEDFLFEVTVNGTMDSAKVKTPELNIAAVVGGIGAALVVIAVVVVALFIVRRRSREAKKSQSNLTGSHCVQQREEPEMTVNELYGTSPGRSTKYAEDEEMIDNIAYVSSADFGNHASRVQGNAYEDVELNSSTNASGGFVSVPGSSRAQASASALKYQTTVNTPNSDDGSNLYATVNKGTKPSLDGQDRPGPAGVEKQRPDVKPKPAKTSKPVKPVKKTTGKKMAKEDDKRLLQAGEYGNVGMASLTMSPYSQEGSVYENYAFQKEEGRKEMPPDKVSSLTVNEDGLVYTTVAFSDKQLKKAAEPPPEREQTEYAGIDFTRKAPPQSE